MPGVEIITHTELIGRSYTHSIVLYGTHSWVGGRPRSKLIKDFARPSADLSPRP